MNSLLTFLRFDRSIWSRVNAVTMPRRTVTVFVAFALAAWNRLGSQAALAPRAPVRMIVTGVYGWLALTVLIWLIARRREADDERSDLVLVQRAAASVSVAHFPLVVLGFYMATIGNFIRSPRPGSMLAVAVFAVWIPALLGRAMRHLCAVDTVTALRLIAIPYLLWLAWIGRYLHIQVGHLL